MTFDIENVPEIMPLEDSKPIVDAWIDMAVNYVKDETNLEIDRNDLMFRLADAEWCFMDYDPNDPDPDDKEFVNMKDLSNTLDDIVWDEIYTLQAEQEEELKVEAWEEIKEIAQEYLSEAMTEEYATYLTDSRQFMNYVAEDVFESSAWEDEKYFNDDDVRMAIGRVILDKMRYIRIEY